MKPRTLISMAAMLSMPAPSVAALEIAGRYGDRPHRAERAAGVTSLLRRARKAKRRRTMARRKRRGW